MGSMLDLINQCRGGNNSKTGIRHLTNGGGKRNIDSGFKHRAIDGWHRFGKRTIEKIPIGKICQMKEQINPKGVTDLKLTGAFHSSFYLAGGQMAGDI